MATISVLYQGSTVLRAAVLTSPRLCILPTTVYSNRNVRHLSSSSESPRFLYETGRLDGATCMVTGASSGIGFAIAQRMLHEGARKVTLVGRSEERLNHALRHLQKSDIQTNTTNEPKVGFGPPDTKSETKTVSPSSLDTKSAGEALEKAKPEMLPSKKDSPAASDTMPISDRLSVLIGDVGNPSFWSEKGNKAMGDVDILVNAAGVSYSSLLPFAKDDAISEMLNTNLQGTIFACRAMMSRALRRPVPSSGNLRCIVNISSLHGVKGGVGAAIYASTKAGVIALTRVIVAEASTSKQGAKLRANVVVPGYIETKILNELSEPILNESKQKVPLRRFGTVEEVADAAMFLVTNQYANNCILNLDGGLSAL
ncbi:hypothetical protein LOZ36_004633 [Ophidiomyces ophidiicola]|nr:hypothetical protein LOZ36_004633 [Ophidiomyces ophidiicola]